MLPSDQPEPHEGHQESQNNIVHSENRSKTRPLSLTIIFSDDENVVIKHQRLSGNKTLGELVDLLDANMNFSDETTPSPQTTMSSPRTTTMEGEATMPSMVQTTYKSVNDARMGKLNQTVNTLMQEMETLKQEMKALKQMIAGTHTNTMSGVADAQHTTTTTAATTPPRTSTPPTTTAPTPTTTAPPTTRTMAATTITRRRIMTATTSSSLTSAGTTSFTPPHVVIQHDTQQFTTITPLTFPCTIRLYPYAQVDVDCKYVIVPSMILCVLANNPDIPLPLASFQTWFFDHIHAINNHSFRLSCEPMSYFTRIAKVIASVVFNRIRSALYTVYPNAGIYDPKNDAGMQAMIVELEKGPTVILEPIVRDGLAVWNPIRVLITHLEAVTTHYSKCTTNDKDATQKAQQVLRRHVANGCSWLQHVLTISLVYGHYLWDSQWVSDDEWETLAKHMTILTREIFPEAYRSLLKMDSQARSVITEDDSNIIRYFKFILGIISCCFLHYYRPMKAKYPVIPYRNVETMNAYPHYVPESVYKTALASSTELLKQCVVEYMESPAAFPEFSPMENLLQTTTTTTTTMDDHASPHDYIMSEVELACNSHATSVSSTRKDGPDRTPHLYWESTVPVYPNFHMSRAFYLTDRVIHAAPHDDPVYKRIAGIYPTHVNRVTLLGESFAVHDDPQFHNTPVYRTRNGNNSQSSVEDPHAQIP